MSIPVSQFIPPPPPPPPPLSLLGVHTLMNFKLFMTTEEEKATAAETSDIVAMEIKALLFSLWDAKFVFKCE